MMPLDTFTVLVRATSAQTTLEKMTIWCVIIFIFLFYSVGGIFVYQFFTRCNKQHKGEEWK